MTHSPEDPPLSTFLETLPLMAARLQPDASIVFVNDELCQRLLLDRQHLVGQPFTSLAQADDRGPVDAGLASLNRDHRAAVVEFRPAKAADSHSWLRWTLLAAFNGDERLSGIECFGRNITRERQMEADVARLAAIVSGADDAIVSKTLEGVVTSWNPAAEAMFGYTPAEIVGRPIALIIPPDRLSEETEILSRLARGERTQHFQTVRLHKSGRPLFVSVNVSPVRDASGRIIGASKIARDITEQRRSQDHLEALYHLADAVGKAHTRREVCEAALEAIVAAMHSDRASVLVFDEAGVMRFIAWRGISDGYRKAVDGHSPWTPGTLNPPPILVEDVLSDPAIAPLRDELTREGVRSLAFVPLVFQDRLLGKFMVYFDAPRVLTPDDRRLAETIGRHVSFGLARVDAVNAERAARMEADAARGEAERASRTKDEFLAMLAHELRNPLGVIVHSVQILATNPAGTPETASSVAMIERQSKHLASLLDDLLDVARITSGRIELRSQPLDLSSVASLAVEAQRVRISSKDQRITLRLSPGPVPVTGDPVRLQQAIGNLVHNATKYTPARGSIWVEVEILDGEAAIRVRDDGAGIPADRLGSIFDLFVQGSPSLARTEGGLGIGLTLVKRVVELHGGRVEGRSEGIGQGAHFEVRLPLGKSEAALVAAVPTPRGPAVAARRILIVEDNEDGREALATLLRLKGHEVFDTGRAQEALAMARDLHPDVVFLDIGLPDLDGYAVAQSLRSSLGPGVRLVALTGYGQPADRDRARQAGFDAHLVKPIDVGQILQILGTPKA